LKVCGFLIEVLRQSPKLRAMKAVLDRAAPKRRRRVAVLIDFSRSYGRGLLLGVARYVKEHHEWSVQSEEWRWTDPAPLWLRNWKGDGVIAWAEAPELIEVIKGLRLPSVDVRGMAGLGLPQVDTENKAVADLAAEHLMQRGFHHYAFCGFSGANYSDQRSHWFQARLAQAGFACAVYQPPRTPRGAQSIEFEKRGLLFQQHLASWLAALPKPVGLMTCNDIRGQQVLNVCRQLELIVPEQIAVVGVDNDEVFCELSDPPLSSVALDTLRIGYEAAALLERIMGGARAPRALAAPQSQLPKESDAPSQRILIPPLGVVTRRSSDVLAMADPQLALGARFMRDHAFDAITVNDIARAAGMSRRVFERRFLARVGRAPKAEVQRLRLERVKALLAETDWPLDRIASKTGYNHGEYLHAIFTEKIGITPGAFRKQAAGRRASPPG
jgi:LacI family transcriptional regulator